MRERKLLIVGAGGHGRVVADIAEQLSVYSEIVFADDAGTAVQSKYLLIGSCKAAEEYVKDYEIVVAVGNAAARRCLHERFESLGAKFATLVHSSAVVSPSAIIGDGTVIMPGGIVNAGAVIGKGVIINTASSVDHDCVVDDYCHIAVGARLCGTVRVGKNTWVGAGVTVINNVSICGDCMIGAGAVVVSNLDRAGTYLGVPARLQE